MNKTYTINEKIIPKSKCGGCGTCALVCPVNAIQMKRDEQGFLYPIINQEMCIHCGKCQKKCPILIRKEQKIFNKTYKQVVYVGKHTKRRIVKESRSGGAFTLFSDEILKMQGSVYGVVFDDIKQKAYYTRALSAMERDRMRGSKYVEADLNSTYRLVKEDIIKNKPVLFVGTPCHVAGLKSYMADIDCSNLYTIDLLCSNVLSSKFFAEYIKVLEKVYRTAIRRFNFRDKTRRGWGAHEESFYVGKKKIYMHLYANLYSSRIFSRPSCDNCTYRGIVRCGDVSIGDAWGDRTRDNIGKSIILCNTEKGKSFFDKVKENGVFEEVDVQNYLQLGLVKKKFVIANREKAWKDLNQHGVAYSLIFNYGVKKIIKGLKK